MALRPIFKKIHPVFEVEPGVLRLGELFGTAVELEDENGAIRRLVELMDGSRTVSGLHQELKVDYPELTEEDVQDAVEEIHRLGFLYDQNREEHQSLSESERRRYKGNLNFFMHYADFEQSPSMIQERLKGAKVTILGMGAFGSSILFQLAGLGVEQVRIVDFDRVELSNLNRQMLFNESDLGRKKVEVAKEFMSRFHSTMRIETMDMEIRSAEDADRAIAGSDVVVLAADQPFVVLMSWVNEVCVKRGIPMIGGGILLNTGTVLSMIPGQTGCFDCMLLRRVELAEDYPQILESYLDMNFIVPNTAIAPILMAVTGVISMEIVRMLTGIGTVHSAGKMLRVDLMSLETKVIQEWGRYEDHCPTCGKGDAKQSVFQIVHKSEYAERSVVPR